MLEKIITDLKILKIITLVSYCCIYIEGDHIGGPYILLLFYSLSMVLYTLNIWHLLLVLIPIAGTIGLLVSVLSKEGIKNEYAVTACFVAMLSPFLIDIFSGSGSTQHNQVIYHITLSIFISIGALMLIATFMDMGVKEAS